MKVFISHADADSDLAKRVSDGLRNSGFQVWDRSDVLPGDNWGTKLGEALDDSDAMVVLLTPSSVNSPSVTNEVGFAMVNRSYKGRVIPVLAAAPEQLPREQLPWVLARLQMIQLDESDKNEEGLQKIAQALKASA